MTQPIEARNGPSSASPQAARSNIPTPNLSDNVEIKRDGLMTSAHCAPSGPTTEGDAARDARTALVERLTQQIVAALDRRDIPSEKPQPKGRDADTLARTISEIDAIVQSEAESLSATANLARRAVIAARKQASGALQSLLGDLAGVLATLSYQAGDLSNTVNGEAEAVGCNHVRDWDEVQA